MCNRGSFRKQLNNSVFPKAWYVRVKAKEYLIYLMFLVEKDEQSNFRILLGKVYTSKF